jgi:predicted NUDIX family NTP pyrophosphohydrolase
MATSKVSAGLVLYRFKADTMEFLLVHPGGPFWKNKDAGAWTIPKGELAENEEPLATALREFEEELGFNPAGKFIPLMPIKQKSGKVIHAWAVEGDCEPEQIRSNTFSLEWPPHSGKRQDFPEVDRAAFFPLEQAKEKINPAQWPLLEETAKHVT